MRISKLLAIVLGVLLMLLGIIALVTPDRVLAIARFTTTPNGVYVAAAIRLGIGLILLFAASGSRFPNVLRVLGALAVIGSIATLFLGVGGARAMAERLLPYGTAVIRGFGTFILIVGAFVMYAVGGSGRTELRNRGH
jgi:hypothetical protein